jgi:dTDP-4-dehydrorhamnose 3,5-epimerase
LRHEDLAGIPEFALEETFVSNSIKGALRGMHLQVEEASNWRIIQVLNGEVFDVLLDLRPEEPTFLTSQINVLSSKNPQTLLVPPGVAHGFQSLDHAEMLYMTSHRYVAALDKGINPLTIGVEWPIEISAISERDLALPDLMDY